MHSPSRHTPKKRWSISGAWQAMPSAPPFWQSRTHAADGAGEPRQLTRGTAVWTFDAIWSPDGSKLAYADKNQTLWSVDVESGERTEVDRSSTNDIQQYRWSPDGKWLTYDKQSQVGLGEIWLWSAESGSKLRLSDGFTNDRGAVFEDSSSSSRAAQQPEPPSPQTSNSPAGRRRIIYVYKASLTF